MTLIFLSLIPVMLKEQLSARGWGISQMSAPPAWLRAGVVCVTRAQLPVSLGLCSSPAESASRGTWPNISSSCEERGKGFHFWLNCC